MLDGELLYTKILEVNFDGELLYTKILKINFENLCEINGYVFDIYFQFYDSLCVQTRHFFH